MLNKFELHHVGWVTNDFRLFEKFWVDLLGYRRIAETLLTSEMAKTLFGCESPALIRRYNKTEAGAEIEIHQFLYGISDLPQSFHRFGINHVCLHVEGSRKDFLDNLPLDIPRHVFNNPRGYQNIFIRDYEDNWVELREAL